MASKSKFFRVATEGATTDGRKIERKWIEQMAKNFNREKYGARVWLEHYRGTVPGGPFDAAIVDPKLRLFVTAGMRDNLVMTSAVDGRGRIGKEIAPAK